MRDGEAEGMPMTVSRALSLAVLAAVAMIPAANAQNSAACHARNGAWHGRPGVGGLGFGGQPIGPPPACQQVLAMREETQESTKINLAARSHTHVIRERRFLFST